MEGNRDEAEKCIGIARQALEDGNRDRALRFLGKAQKLYPTETARGEARLPPRSRCPRPGSVGTGPDRPRGPQEGGRRGPSPGGPCRLRRAGPGPKASPGAVAGRVARLGKEAGECAQELRSGQVPPPASA